MNPVLHRLDFDDGDRAVIIHADDIGMCQATLPAYAELLDAGLLSSAAVMVPCPWFPEVAAFCRAHPEVDMGVHLTLTSEWDSYRWGPISTRDPAAGMLDEEGYFPRTTPGVTAGGDAQAVEVELRAQLDRALEAGIDVTHVDSHMGSAFHHKFIPGYVRVARDRRVPPFFLTPNEERIRSRGIDAETAAVAAAAAQELGEQGMPLFDDIRGLPLNQPDDQVAAAKQLIDTLKPGLTVLILHPAVDTPELRAIAPDWPSRVANYKALLSPELRDHVRASGVQVIGYRVLRDLMRREA